MQQPARSAIMPTSDSSRGGLNYAPLSFVSLRPCALGRKPFDRKRCLGYPVANGDEYHTRNEMEPI